MDGIFPLVKSLDHVGPMAASIDDVGLIWRALANPTPWPRTARPQRVGYDPAWVDFADQPVRAAFDLACAGSKSTALTPWKSSFPTLTTSWLCSARSSLPEAAAYHRAHYGDNIDCYPAIARQWFGIAREMSVGTYVDACARRVAMTRDIDRLLEEVDAIVTPTLCVAPPPRHAETITVAGKEDDFTMGLVRFTCLFDHTGSGGHIHRYLLGDS